MQTTNSRRGYKSASFWLTLLLAAGIIFIGARFIMNPAAGAEGFGIPFASTYDVPYARIKGIRDIFSGIVLLLFLFLNMRRAAAIALTAAIMIPAADFCNVLVTNGAKDVQHLLIHGLTTVYMVVTGVLLFQKKDVA